MSAAHPAVDTDKLSYEIFSILESKFLFGYDHHKLWIPKSIPPPPHPVEVVSALSPPPKGICKNPRGKICVLSVDGGGMRNILSGKALAYLEKALKEKSGDPDARICDYFDVAAGSGVGGIFTAMLFGTRDQSRPIFGADETWRFLVENGGKLYPNSGRSGFFRRIFRNDTSPSAAGLEKAMKEAFADEKTGRVLTLKDTLKPVLIPCYDLSSGGAFVFSRADALESDGFDFRLWEVCRATSAEAGVFGPVRMSSVDGSTRCVAVDGGVAMPNPTAAAITHVLHNMEEFPLVRGVEDILVLSLGTGQLLEGGGLSSERAKEWKGNEWARISGDCAADLVDHAVAMSFGQSRSSNYVRIQANGSSLGGGANLETDPSPKNARKLVGIAEEMLTQKNVESVLFGGKRIGEESNSQKLDWFAGELVEERRRRRGISPLVTIKKAAPPPPSKNPPAY